MLLQVELDRLNVDNTGGRFLEGRDEIVALVVSMQLWDKHVKAERHPVGSPHVWQLKENEQASYCCLFSKDVPINNETRVMILILQENENNKLDHIEDQVVLSLKEIHKSGEMEFFDLVWSDVEKHFEGKESDLVGGISMTVYNQGDLAKAGYFGGKNVNWHRGKAGGNVELHHIINGDYRYDVDLLVKAG